MGCQSSQPAMENVESAPELVAAGDAVSAARMLKASEVTPKELTPESSSEEVPVHVRATARSSFLTRVAAWRQRIFIQTMTRRPPHFHLRKHAAEVLIISSSRFLGSLIGLPTPP